MLKKIAGVLVGVAPLSAMAAVDPAASGVVTGIVADAGTVAGYGWAILAAIFGGLIIMGVFKAYARKGAGR